MYKNYKNLNKN